MNRFRTKKKAREEEMAPRPSQDSDSSMPFRGFRKGKKSQEVEKIEVDLSTALPSNDDFRTSLLMTGLSARFSMLREQDDPNTKIGKASDDSVLYPKRQSKMDFRGLGDIAEVESTKATLPFARVESFHSDDADSENAGSIMNRAKPIEGNVLFGGRQKIYKLSANANSSRTLDGGMGGRALYDDDVAQSAFQKWRRAEKERERELSQDEADDSDGPDHQRDSTTDLEPPRSDSPTFSAYNQKRETSSTLSSIPSIARHSSAATSIASQPAPSLKDWQPPSGPSSATERSVTRTRRLYETGFLTQDTQDSSMGILNRQKPFGARTPDPGQQSPSLGFDRLSGERKLLAKGSAPNLRSMSPPASASSTNALNLGIQVLGTGENKSSIGVPPISPPISETEENSILSINPNDRGKATALGVFRKPAQPYDDSRYTERQLQLQRGRDTPTLKAREESNAAASGNQSGSMSPSQPMGPDSPTVPISEVTQFAVRNEAQPTSFLAESDRSETSSLVSPRPLPSPQIHLQRPSDREHPAFRDSASATNLSLNTKAESELPPITERPSSLVVDNKVVLPADSPTLGPGVITSGLSGMVRQHLRADSNASSIYDAAPSVMGLDSRFPPGATSSSTQQGYTVGSPPWDSENNGQDWNLDIDVNEPLGDAESVTSNSGRLTDNKMDLPLRVNDNKDEFANQLADGARRVRERLTSYVETDSRSSSPHRLGENTEVDLAPLPRPSGLGAILRPRSSRGSLTDRGRDPSSTRAFKMRGISPGGSRTSSPGSESHRGQEGEERERTQSSEDQHPGLRQFRQAKRELQRFKERESQTRHFPAPQEPPPDIPSPRQRNVNPPGGSRIRTPSRDHKPPPVHYQQRIPQEEFGNIGMSPPSQRSPPNERQRSESESSHGTRPNHMHLGPPLRSSPHPAQRSPGLPGTDIKRSHIMPPQPYPNASSRPNQYVHSVPPTPDTSLPARPFYPQNRSSDATSGPFTGQEPTRRRANPRDISESSLVTSPSRSPAGAFPHETEDVRSRSNSRTAAPPVPPLNPRRRQDSAGTLRTVAEPFSRQGRDYQGREVSTGTQNLPFTESNHGVERRGVNTTGMNGFRGNGPPSNVGLPGSRVAPAQGRNPQGSARLPGGMI